MVENKKIKVGLMILIGVALIFFAIGLYIGYTQGRLYEQQLLNITTHIGGNTKWILNDTITILKH